jgi:hypothetical protein
MPLFAGPIQSVYRVQMFARGRSDGRQLLVYSIAYRASDDALLVIPLATPPDLGPENIGLIGLPKARDFFEDLARGFPPDVVGDDGATERIAALPFAPAIEPMFVPSLAILTQLIGHLPLPAGIANDVQAYAGHSFAMVTLPKGHVRLHPFAIEFPRRKADQLRFPTGILRGAMFDFDPSFTTLLYAQSRSPMPDWEPSGEGGPGARLKLAGQFIDTRLSRNVVDPMRTVFHKPLYMDAIQRDSVVYETKAR